MRVVGLLNVLAVTVGTVFLVGLVKSEARGNFLECARNYTPRGHLNGIETICLIIHEYPRRVLIFRVNDTDDPRIPLAGGFAQNETPEIGAYREDAPVPGCLTRSGLSKDELPRWTEWNDLKSLEEKLKTHCFMKKRFMDVPQTLPYRALYKVMSKQEELDYVKIGILVPDSERYLIFQDSRDLLKLCTRCGEVAGAYGQLGLVKTSNLTEILLRIRQKE